MGAILVTCRNRSHAEAHYLPPLRLAGWTGSIHLLAVENPFQDPAGLLTDAAGVLLTGGRDIHPRHWDVDEPIHSKAEIDPDRDDLEIPLVRAAWELGLPILGICRGAQVLNVALGGSLIQDIPSHFRCPEDQHQFGPSGAPSLRHPVEVVGGSRLASLLELTRVDVNSRHHQAVRRVAPELWPVALDPATRNQDGSLVEAVESRRADRWALGVQWHPEDLVELEGLAGHAARRLFEGFVGIVKNANGADGS
jgi:putative glutamine amidotransferase